MSRPEDGFTPTLGEVLDARAKSAQTLAEVLLAELPLSGDGTGHVADCGYTDETQTCGCYSLPGRLTTTALAWFAERLAPITAPDEVGDGWVRVENIRALVAAREEVGPQ